MKECNEFKEELDLINASNDGLIIAEGYNLAVVDENGAIIQKGVCINKEIFEKLSKEVVKSFCTRFKGFKDSDFK